MGAFAGAVAMLIVGLLKKGIGQQNPVASEDQQKAPGTV
jgi:hypothetical protein